MPALLERPPIINSPADHPVSEDNAKARESPDPAPPAATPDEIGSPVSRICSACYLSEPELNRTGLLGCPRCYETFASIIAAAAETLHGVRVPPEWAEPEPRHTVTNPWPTRRAVRIASQ